MVDLTGLLLLQTTAAATVAWIAARVLAGHDDPFFAPIATLVALSQPLGERGCQPYGGYWASSAS